MRKKEKKSISKDEVNARILQDSVAIEIIDNGSVSSVVSDSETLVLNSQNSKNNNQKKSQELKKNRAFNKSYSNKKTKKLASRILINKTNNVHEIFSTESRAVLSDTNVVGNGVLSNSQNGNSESKKHKTPLDKTVIVSDATKNNETSKKNNKSVTNNSKLNSSVNVKAQEQVEQENIASKSSDISISSEAQELFENSKSNNLETTSSLEKSIKNDRKEQASTYNVKDIRRNKSKKRKDNSKFSQNSSKSSLGKNENSKKIEGEHNEKYIRGVSSNVHHGTNFNNEKNKNRSKYSIKGHDKNLRIATDVQLNIEKKKKALAQSEEKNKQKKHWLGWLIYGCLSFISLVTVFLIILFLSIHNIRVFAWVNNHTFSRETLNKICYQDTNLKNHCSKVTSNLNQSESAARVGMKYKKLWEASVKAQNSQDKSLYERFIYNYLTKEGYYEDYARYWLRIALEKNDRIAQFGLYELYTSNNEYNKTSNEMLLRSSAAQGYAPALFHMYTFDIGGSKNINFPLLQEAALQNYLPAMEELGIAYMYGLHTEVNEKEAERILLAAVQKGSFKAMDALIKLYNKQEYMYKVLVWAEHFENCYNASKTSVQNSNRIIYQSVKNRYSKEMLEEILNSLSSKQVEKANRLKQKIARDYSCKL